MDDELIELLNSNDDNDDNAYAHEKSYPAFR